ncbi:imidazoleglycerol-phosphate dehydratase [Ectobacillus polymachus]|uniref:imidazoleglycerol-phosphate dehydratase n=1 Tax=Ectobacillus polymachus TaxID=1508806 RepID=UPI003A8BBAE2
MSSHNGSKGSKNQSSPSTNWSIEEASSIGNSNKGNEYRSRKGSKSQKLHKK